MTEAFGDPNWAGSAAISSGPSTGLIENFDAAFDSAQRSGTSMAAQTSISNDWNDNLDKATALTGNPFNTIRGLRPAAGIMQQRYDTEMQAYDKLRETNPNLHSLQQITDLTTQQIQGAEANTAEVSGRANFAGEVGGFLGSNTAMLNPVRAPVEFSTLFLGGGGTTLATKILSEAAVVGSGMRVAAQSTEDERARLGLSPGDPNEQALETALFAGALRGALHLGGAAVRGVGESLRPDLGNLDFNDPQLAQLFAAAPDTPMTRAAHYAVESDRLLADQNLYGTTPEANQRLFDELDAINQITEGNKTDTAISRVLSTDPISFDANFDLNLDTVRTEQPQLAAELDALEARHADLSAQEDALSTTIDNRTLGDAAGTVDETSGELIKDYEAQLQQPNLSVADRDELNRRIGQVTDELGPDLIARREANAQRGLKQQLRGIRTSRQTAQKALNRLRTKMGDEVAKVANRQELLERIKNAQTLPAVREAGNPIPTRVEATAARVHEAATGAPDAASAVVEKNRPPEVKEPVAGAEPEPKPAPGVDIGLDHNIPDDFSILVDGKEMTARQIMNDLVSDADLEEIMKGCSL